MHDTSARLVDRVLPAASCRSGCPPAAVTFVQPFGGALNLHVQFHSIVSEALFAKDGHM